MPRFPSPLTRERLLLQLRRPAGFYVALALALCGAKVGWDWGATSRAVGMWPPPLFAIAGFVAMVLLSMALIALLYFGFVVLTYTMGIGLIVAHYAWRGVRTLGRAAWIALIWVLDTAERAFD